MNVLILCPYPHNEAPSQRFRFEQYLTYLSEHNIICDTQSFWDEKTWRILYKDGYTIKKISGFVRGWLRRLFILFKLSQYDVVFIHREAAPVGPPIIEWLLAKVFKKKLIYDFDDAIWMPNASTRSKLIAALKFHKKVASICRWSWKVSCGNEYLADYARSYNSNVTVIPTTVDTDYHSQIFKNNKPNKKPTIGWTGSHSTNQYLHIIEDVLHKLKQHCDFEFLVISNHPPAIKFPNRFIKWTQKQEIEDLSEIDIGVMPLPDDQWSKGKCGFKLIQYLSIGITAVASPVGVNSEIVIPNQTGLLASNIEEWVSALEKLVSNFELREKLGKNGRDHIEKHYSVNSQKQHYLKLFY